MLDFQNYRNQTGFIGTTYVPTKVNNNLLGSVGTTGNHHHHHHQHHYGLSSSPKVIRPVMCPCKSSSEVEVGKLLDMALLKRQNLMMSKQTTTSTTSATKF
ncbi:hypothetical protein FDP41_004372 [Naegleria fowleri]|uniref:Uncharacterized protein n=1 Tax=Naegleria fowleri TaxID=5763 RepID=A0A6A5BF80_NAEFO|nr:uncharacterized protein FDP41_004372 [Naegleria fowleri]KAF0976473.1 hypothetical protein FDP41_004372 [Naegleria fowleri]